MIHVITEQDMVEHGPALIAWAEANGLDPQHIVPHGLTVEHVGDRQVINFTECVVAADGRKILDLTGPSRYQTARRIRPLRHPLPEGIGQTLCACTLSELDPACTEHPVTTEGDQTPGG